MSYDSSGVFTRAGGTTAVAGERITAVVHETEWDDLASALNELPVKDVANIFTNSPQTVTSTDAGALETSLYFTLYRNSASPAIVRNGLAQYIFEGKNSSNARTSYGAIACIIAVPTAASEESVLVFRNMQNGVYSGIFNMREGLYYQGGADPGAGAGNFNGLYSLSFIHSHFGTAIPAGGTAGAGFKLSSTSNFGVFFGSGAPTLAAAKGSLYLRSDGWTTNDRMYVNKDGSTTWAAVTTAS